MVEVKQPSEVEQEEEEEEGIGAQQGRETLAVCAGRDLSDFAMFEPCPLLQKRRRKSSFV